jgi:hypothetical protein
MKCPHCHNSFHYDPRVEVLLGDDSGYYGIHYQICPECRKSIIELVVGEKIFNGKQQIIDKIRERRIVHPKTSSRSPVQKEVPKNFVEDYTEAALVLADSPKASAALSRRCLQNILREVAMVRTSDLVHEIQEIISSGKLPSYLIQSLDAVRNIGNFAAHPIKSQVTGEIVPVELGEAEWNLDVLEALFDFYFVQPEVIKKRKEALNNKLKDAGKPPVK